MQHMQYEGRQRVIVVCMRTSFESFDNDDISENALNDAQRVSRDISFYARTAGSSPLY